MNFEEIIRNIGVKPYYQDDAVVIYHADCREILPLIPDKSIDLVLTDPPYNLGFMGKKWDKTGIAFSLDLWKEWLRAIKPGGNLLSFGGTRTYHRMACAIEDAGFEIRDCLMWVYGSGFPKSLNIGKAVDKLQGNKREVTGLKVTGEGHVQNRVRGKNDFGTFAIKQDGYDMESKGTSEWEGYGTGLKPAYEPIVLAMAPLDGTFAENCLKWGVGGLNIDGCRIPTEDGKPHYGQLYRKANRIYGGGKGTNTGACLPANPQGRFPANFMHDGSQEVMELFPETGISKGGQSGVKKSGATYSANWKEQQNYEGCGFGDSGSAARFFYCAKASKKERDAGLDDMPSAEENLQGLDTRGRTLVRPDGSKTLVERWQPDKTRINNHPTVKPLALMEYLVKLASRPSHVVLDPFLGSGTTAYCAKKIGRKCIGIETEEKYCEIAAKRLSQTVMNLEVK